MTKARNKNPTPPYFFCICKDHVGSLRQAYRKYAKTIKMNHVNKTIFFNPKKIESIFCFRITFFSSQIHGVFNIFNKYIRKYPLYSLTKLDNVLEKSLNDTYEWLAIEVIHYESIYRKNVLNKLISMKM